MAGFKKFQEQHKKYALKGQSNLAETQSQVQHHYVAFSINSMKQLIELDGRKPGPAVIKENVNKQDLLKAVAEEIKRRLADGHISESMSLLALSMNP